MKDQNTAGGMPLEDHDADQGKRGATECHDAQRLDGNATISSTRDKASIETGQAPRSKGTHSQAIRAGGFVYLTGQTGRGLDGRLADGLEAQTRQVTQNVEAILAAGGCHLCDLVKVTLFMRRIEDFKAIDDIYRAWLPNQEEAPFPARTAVAGVSLPAGAELMLDVIAICSD